MSDNRYLSPNERKNMRPHYDDLHSDPPQLHDLLDHAALCDELITELAEALRDFIEPSLSIPEGVAGIHYPKAEDALKRVDALTQ